MERDFRLRFEAKMLNQTLLELCFNYGMCDEIRKLLDSPEVTKPKFEPLPLVKSIVFYTKAETVT